MRITKVFEVSPKNTIRDGKAVLTPQDKIYVSTPSYSDTPFINNGQNLKEALRERGINYGKAHCDRENFTYKIAGYFQSILRKEEAFYQYREQDGDEEYFKSFYALYGGLHDMYKFRDFAADKAFRIAFNCIRWYSFYKKIGHSDDWCDAALDYNSPDVLMDKDWNLEKYIDKELSYENDKECLQICMNKHPDENELKLHLEFVKEYFKKR